MATIDQERVTADGCVRARVFFDEESPLRPLRQSEEEWIDAPSSLPLLPPALLPPPHRAVTAAAATPAATQAGSSRGSGRIRIRSGSGGGGMAGEMRREGHKARVKATASGSTIKLNHLSEHPPTSMKPPREGVQAKPLQGTAGHPQMASPMASPMPSSIATVAERPARGTYEDSSLRDRPLSSAAPPTTRTLFGGYHSGHPTARRMMGWSTPPRTELCRPCNPECHPAPQPSPLAL